MLEKFLNLIYPNICGFCEEICQDSLCKKCELNLKKYEINNIYSTTINKNNKQKIYYYYIINIFKHENIIRNKIIEYKFNDKSYLYKTFAKIILKNEKICGYLKKYDIIIPIPIHRKRKILRGYNQTELIASQIGKELNILVETKLLKKQKNNISQSKLTKTLRKENVKNVFCVQNNCKLQGRNIIIFDDIFTTGSTVNECSRVLKQSGAKPNMCINNSKRLKRRGANMEDLLESILDYVRAEYTDYAIMINGEWGSGKTYFWNNKIRNKIDSLQLNGKHYTTIYMSLYGISNLEDISKKIFIETTQLMDKNVKKYMNSTGQTTIPEYAKTGLDMANLFGVTQNGDKVDYNKFFSTDDKVLCFDDLERANVDVIDILGYINNFVEHDHIKTIIICNEKELATKLKSTNLEMKTFIATYLLDKEGNLSKTDKPMVEKIRDKIEYVFDKANDYERIKEKLIGETFEYVPEFNYIINGILMRYESNTELIRFLRENTNYIVSTFNKSGTRNLRILKHALNDFKKIYEMVNKNYPNTNYRILQTMLIFTIAISFEIKAGKITKDKFINIENNEAYKALLVSSRVLNDNRQFYIKEFDNNYYYNFKIDFRFFKFIEIYVRTRIFDMKTFKKDMEVIIKTIDTEKLPAYKRLLIEEYWKISDDKFPFIIEEIFEDVKEGKVELIDTVKIFKYFSYFIKKGLIDYDIKNIKNIFFNAMNTVSLTSTYCENAKEELSQITIGDTSPEIDEIIKHFNIINNMLRDKMYTEKANDIFKNIPMKMELFYERFDKECMNVPILKYYDSYQMFQRILCASNEDVVTIKEKLMERVEKNSQDLIEEYKNLAELKNIIDDYVKGKTTSIKLVMIKEFSRELEIILTKYK